jgi:hypothetical protein
MLATVVCVIPNDDAFVSSVETGTVQKKVAVLLLAAGITAAAHEAGELGDAHC